MTRADAQEGMKINEFQRASMQFSLYDNDIERDVFMLCDFFRTKFN